ncbi:MULTISPECIES: hypothetical protein [unclassified Pseudonocardia]|uniref:hypothetical protein n=1 Tax=unclassified Pseudonocardia TaxID=2619320 RepID=UPI001AC2F832|nr:MULTISPECIES: hypothetical protein [unclassified Pseudonocardia]MBN9098023.1 hypothetical protein [Pseudonocardia sp.]
MGDMRQRQWERVLLVLATLFGVVAMHATVAPVHDQAGPMTGASVGVAAPVIHDPAAVHPVDHVGDAPEIVSSGKPSDAPMPMPHSLMHLCLAIMTMAILLGLLVIVRMMLWRHDPAPHPPAMPVSAHPSRPPPSHAVRLAQLCVLRN